MRSFDHDSDLESLSMDSAEGIVKTFSIFLIMYNEYLYSPGPQQSNAPTRFSKFDGEHTISSLFRFWSIYRHMGTKIETSSKKRVPSRI